MRSPAMNQTSRTGMRQHSRTGTGGRWCRFSAMAVSNPTCATCQSFSLGIRTDSWSKCWGSNPLIVVWSVLQCLFLGQICTVHQWKSLRKLSKVDMLHHGTILSVLKWKLGWLHLYATVLARHWVMSSFITLMLGQHITHTIKGKESPRKYG